MPTTAAERNIISRIKQDYDFAKAERDRHVGDWENWRKQYDGEWSELTKETKDEDLHQWFYVPKTKTIIHRLECSARSYFLASGQGKKLSKVLPTTSFAGVPQAAAMLDAVLHNLVDIELNPTLTLQSAFKTSLVEGPAVLQMGWRTEQGESGPENHADLWHVPNEEVVWDPYAIRLKDISFIIREVYLTEDELWDRQRRGIYQNVEEVLKAAASAETEKSRTRLDKQSPDNSARKLYKLLEFWGPQQLLDTDELATLHQQGQHAPAVDVVATVFEDKVLLRLQENPYAKLRKDPSPLEKLPFTICTPLPCEPSTYGYSMAEWIRASQTEINLMRNQRRQAVNAELVRKVFYDQNKMTDQSALEDAKYCGTVAVNGNPREAVYDFAPTTSTNDMVREEVVMDRDLQDLTGVNDYMMGATTPGMQHTATGVSTLTAEGNAIQDVMLENIAETAILPMVSFYAACAVRFVTPAEVQRAIGSLTTPPPLTQVLGYEWRIELEAGVSASSKGAQIANINHALASLGQIAGAAPQAALPAMIILTTELLRLLDVGESGQALQTAVQNMQNAQPGQNQQAGPGDPQQQQAQMQQGRSPSMQESQAAYPGP